MIVDNAANSFLSALFLLADTRHQTPFNPQHATPLEKVCVCESVSLQATYQLTHFAPQVEAEGTPEISVTLHTTMQCPYQRTALTSITNCQ